MALTLGSISGAITWMLSKANTGFGATKQNGKAAQTISYTAAITNQLAAKTVTIAASGTATIDLSTGTDLVGDAIAMGKAMGFFISATGANVKVTCSGANGLSGWFLQASGELHVKAGGLALVGWPETTPATVDSTHKIITITNLSGSAVATVTYAALGGT